MKIEQLNELVDLGIDQLEVKFRDTKNNKKGNVRVNVKSLVDLNKYHGINGLEEVFEQFIHEAKNIK